MADIAASVPLETNRTISIEGTARTTSSASSISRRVGAPKLVPWAAVRPMASTTGGNACPLINGPQLITKSTYLFPSTSQRNDPSPRSMKRGVPPTAANARTGLFTPPGMSDLARAKSSSDLAPAVVSRSVVMVTVLQALALSFPPARPSGSTQLLHLDHPSGVRNPPPQEQKHAPPVEPPPGPPIGQCR